MPEVPEARGARGQRCQRPEVPEAEVPEARGARGQRWTFDRLGMFYHIGQGGPKIASRITHTLLTVVRELNPLFGMECLRKEKQKRGLSSRGFCFFGNQIA